MSPPSTPARTHATTTCVPATSSSSRSITFTANGANLTVDGDDFTLVGDLTLRGVTLPITLKGEVGGVIDDPYGNVRAGVTATTKINRQDFGVSWNAALEAGGFTLGDDVTITIDLEVVLQK